ncbi:MAG: RluA family pseudouridine synthase [Thermoanaerobaculia bacterium]
MRLDQAIAARFPDISRRQARELIASRRILVNDRPVSIASRHTGDSDRIVIADEDLPPVEVIASGSDWIAVNKPAGMPTQPPADRSRRSMEELLRLRSPEIYLVHRIDTPTSGIVLFATTRSAAARLSELFANRQMRKTYLAAIDGPLSETLTIDTEVGGRSATTSIRTAGGRLIEAEIETGRTHQIRVHLASIGRPVVGDRRYGGSAASRLMLHAWKLGHATLGELVAPPPLEFDAYRK